MKAQTKTLLVGTIVGAMVGLAMAWIATDSEKDEEGNPLGITSLNTGDYFQLGMAILTLARQFSGMVKKT